MILLVSGMAAGGIWLLDYLVRGEEVAVPRLYGMTKAEAVETLVEHELIPDLPIKQVINEDVPAGIIIEQIPAPETKVKKGRSVTLTVSTGPQEIHIPDLVGNRLEDVSGLLRNAGLQIGQRASTHHHSFTNGEIISQDPLPGKRIVIGKRINLLVSLGSPPIELVMPRLIGKTWNEATSQFDHNLITLREEHIEYRKTPDSSQWNRIIEQNPEPGAKVIAGESIKLTIGSSGTEISELRMVHVTFPFTFDLESEYVCLQVWDDRFSIYYSPTLIPVDVSPFKREIDQWIAVFGDAVITLAEGNSMRFLQLTDPVKMQYFPAPPID